MKKLTPIQIQTWAKPPLELKYAGGARHAIDNCAVSGRGVYMVVTDFNEKTTYLTEEGAIRKAMSVQSGEVDCHCYFYSPQEVAEAVKRDPPLVLQVTEQLAAQNDLLAGRLMLYRNGDYIIVNSTLESYKLSDSNPMFRVINLKSGTESNLYNLAQCLDIVNLAVANQLLGSFN